MYFQPTPKNLILFAAGAIKEAIFPSPPRPIPPVAVHEIVRDTSTVGIRGQVITIHEGIATLRLERVGSTGGGLYHSKVKDCVVVTDSYTEAGRRASGFI